MSRQAEALVAKVLRERPDALPLDRDRVGELLYHGHCHQKALFGTEDGMCVLSAASGDHAARDQQRMLRHGRCVRARGGALRRGQGGGGAATFPRPCGSAGRRAIAVSGFSCRHQIEHHTGVEAKHVMEYLADALVEQEG